MKTNSSWSGCLLRIYLWGSVLSQELVLYWTNLLDLIKSWNGLFHFRKYSKTYVKRPLKNRQWQMVAWGRSKVLAFCNTFDLHKAIIGLENQFLVFLWVAVLHWFYCSIERVIIFAWFEFFIEVFHNHREYSVYVCVKIVPIYVC